MTWVVGMATPFGYGAGISDIRVTLGDGRERDCLQKIYPVGNSLALGFAGSVRIGFAMVERFKELLYVADETKGWDPEAVAGWFPDDARDVFFAFPEAERCLQSHLILIGVHPVKHSGNPDWPKSYIHTFRSPNFALSRTEPREVVGIGCGSEFEPCRDALASISNDHEEMMKVRMGEQGTRGGMLSMLGLQLTTLLKKAQPRGISSHLHYCWVYRHHTVISTNDHTTVGRWSMYPVGLDSPFAAGKEGNEPAGRSIGSPEMPVPGFFKMPRIADSWEELQHLLRAEGASAVGTVA
jgi:hypothetical protein